jgi:hypothetical protein
LVLDEIENENMLAVLRELYKYLLGMVNINLMLALEINSCYDKQQNVEVVYVKIEILLFN